MFGRSSARAAANEQKETKEAKKRNERRAARLRCANMGFVSCVWRGLLDDTEQATIAAQHNPAVDGGQSMSRDPTAGISLRVEFVPWIALVMWTVGTIGILAVSLHVSRGSSLHL